MVVVPVETDLKGFLRAGHLGAPVHLHGLGNLESWGKGGTLQRGEGKRPTGRSGVALSFPSLQGWVLP